jgi:hypothetical protein
MRIVVNHLTRMERGYICVAGIDLATGRHVRPCLDRGRLRANLLARNGGLFDIAVTVDIPDARHTGKPPEVEDHLFDPRRASRVTDMAPPEFWQRLVDSSAMRLRDLFGTDLMSVGRNSCGVEEGKGEASLGCLIPTGRPLLRLEGRPGRPDAIRMWVADGEFAVNLSVTDIRLCAEDHVTPANEAIARVQDRLATGVEVILAVGLSRAFQATRDQPPMHWLQVNNIHLRDDPCWRPG